MAAGLEGITMPTVASPELDATIWQSGSNPVTASSFRPPPTYPARAWERVPVPAVIRPCKIWKRTVSEPGTDAESLQYALSMAELESQEQSARKRSRKMRHVPVWGDAQWDARVEEPRDGSWDLVEARAAVAELHDEYDEETQPAIQGRPATYPEEKLRWVPRKRHNSRWPIEPMTTTKTTMMAELQPLVEFELPTADIETAAAQHSPQRATDKQMRRRSTRRLSRRVSLAFIEDGSFYQSPIGRRISMVGATPAKSSPINKVATSPRKAFTLLASPTKVLFRPSPTKASSPAKAVQLSPPTSSGETPEVDDSSLLSMESSVLVFDQPVPEVQAEPAHETRRRVSLQNAMRRDRSTTRGRKSFDSDAAHRSAPNRRHSFMPPQSTAEMSAIKSRRHTLDAFGENATVTMEMEQDEETTTGFSSAETTENISEVVVNVCANLDIFGTKSGVTRRRKARRASSHSDDKGDAPSSPLSSTNYSSQNVDDSPLPIGLGITQETGGDVDSPDQAAMLDTSFNSHSDDCDEADTPSKDFWLDDGIGSTPQGRPSDTRAPANDDEQQEDMFAPHDPDGLSTIFEDEEASFAQSSPLSQLATVEAEEICPSSPSEPASVGVPSTEAGSLSPTTTAELDIEHPAVTSEGKSDGKPDEEDLVSEDDHDEKMEQSFDFTLDATEVAQQKPGAEHDAVPSADQLEHTADRPTMSSPLSVRSFRDEEDLVDATIVVDDFSVLQPEAESDAIVSTPEKSRDTASRQTTSSPLSTRSFRDEDQDGTMVVEDFSVHEPSMTERTSDAATGPVLSSPLSARSFRDEEMLLDGTMVVDDFSIHETADKVEGELKQDQQATSSEHGTADAMTASSSPRSQIEVASSPAADAEETDAPASTPPQATATTEVEEDADKVLDTPTSKGFTPINSDRVSPPVSSSPAKEVDAEEDEGDDLQDEDMALAMDYEPTVPINMDEEMITVQGSEPDAEPVAEQEDSETEMLRKFVTRVSANKSAKAAAAALARRNLRPKRRSGSTGSTTSSTGSPVAKSASSASTDSASKASTSTTSSSEPQKPRFPLGEKDANSPSPTKKRKAHHGKSHSSGKMNSDDLFSGNQALYSAEISPPKSKRLRSRRKAAEADSDNTTNDNTSTQPSPDQQQQQPSPLDMDTSLDSTGGNGGSQPRRSTRSRNSRIQLKPPAPSANSIALSLIPVRLPGSSGGGMIMNAADTSGDKDMPTPVVVSRTARTTAQEKDLAAVTRVNTRKNKAGAVPPKVILSRQAEDPLGFKLKELKGVFDAKEGRDAGSAEDLESGAGADEKDGGRSKSRKDNKGVRWASELVRYNTDFEASGSPRHVVAMPLVPVRKGAKKAELLRPSEDGDGYFPATGDENAPPPAAAGVEAASVPKVAAVEEKKKQESAVAEEKDQKDKQEPKKAAPTRRTRQSRLQMPTPISKKILAGDSSASAGSAGVAPTPAAATVSAAGKVASSGTGVASASVVKMATRRTKIASLGMGVNGTPAPKRRTKT